MFSSGGEFDQTGDGDGGEADAAIVPHMLMPSPQLATLLQDKNSCSLKCWPSLNICNITPRSGFNMLEDAL